uniref:peroxisomal bifunctional enzyme-like isoform X2 n=1 Tax=Ciona intestinalis TaxID=7719 RepID=UPI00089DCFA8|nr:peroxisomal bifunctional enzyme-like isoform X2 [Ciona intestinalis]|eukprot:XP_018671351.1 peroxisomal bifunctional enzyme-like isoform X2 [Ciona intestinalis]
MHRSSCWCILSRNYTMATLMNGSQYADLSEQKLRNWSLPSTTANGNVSPMMVRKTAVLGLGTMGKIVYVFEMNKTSLDSGVNALYDILHRLVQRKLMTQQNMQQLKAAIIPSHNYNDLHDVDLVIEAVFEDKQLKKTIFKKLDEVCKPSAILATNTSSLNIDEIASVTKRPDKVIGMHFFAPAHLMRLLENVRGSNSSPQTIVTAMDLGKQMNKVTVLVGNCKGFVGNRMYFYYIIESDFLLEEGAYPHEVDKALTDYGFTMGRYQVGDLSGNDVHYRVREMQGMLQKQQPTSAPERYRNGVRYCPLADMLVEAGRHGQKTDGKGWYQYIAGSRMPRIDPQVIKMIDDHRTKHNIKPRKISEKEIIERLLYPMINEGFKILEDGIADNPWDIDMVWLHGYAWPRNTGGPMFYANTVGLPQVLKVIEERWKLAGASEPHWKPSKMLTWLIKHHGNPDINDWIKLYKERNARKRSNL